MTEEEIQDEIDIDIERLRDEWLKSLPRFSDNELFKIFPEAKVIIPEKIKEWEKKREKVVEIIKEKLKIIMNYGKSEFGKWFYREWLKVNEGEEFLKIDWQITRLKRLLTVARGQNLKGRLTEQQIQQALAVPIESLINQPLRKCGKALVSLCPFHRETNPSFFIYPASNSFYCYGCQRGGNVITFVMEYYNFSFKKAVEFLLNNF
jgi:hypothetical protein